MKRWIPATTILILASVVLAVVIVAGVFDASPALAQADARVWVAHFAPFADSVDGTAVTVRVNGTDALTDFKFGETSGGYVDLSPGTTLVEVVLPGDTVAISDTFTLNAGVDYTVAAIGDITNQDLELLALLDDNTAPTSGEGKVRVAHLAPFDAVLANTIVDVRTEDGTLVVDNVPYKGYTDPYLSLPAGLYDLKLTTPDGATDLLDIPPFLLADGQILSVYAIGDITNQPLDVLALSQVGGAMARVWVGHFAPFAASVDDTAVTVRVNGTDALIDFKFGETSGGYVDLSPGTTLVEVVLPGDTVAISDTFTLNAGVDYTVAAIGDGTNQDLELLALLDDNTAPASGEGKVRVAHLAPFTDTLAATTVDVRTDAGAVVVNDVQYKGYTDPYLSLPAGVYDLKLTTPDGATDLFDISPLLLADGEIVSVFALGDIVNQPLMVKPLIYDRGTLKLYYFPLIFKE